MIRGFAITDRGNEKPLNEDKVLLGESVISAGQFEYEGNAPLFAAVFDGVSSGGHGAEASGIAAAAFMGFCKRVERATNGDRVGDETLQEAFEEIQAEMLEYQHATGSDFPVATTISGIHVSNDGGVTGFNSGDSRVYRFRNGMLVQMTTDHTVIQSMADMGASDPLLNQAKRAEAHVITRALGIPQNSGDLVEVEDFGMLEPDDIYLGCTDGLSGFINRDTIKRVLSQGAPLSVSGRTLVEIALRNGSQDNISVFLLSRTESSALLAIDNPAHIAESEDSDCAGRILPE